MFPVLFHIGDLPVHSFGLLLALGALTAWLWSRRCGRRHGLEPRLVDDLFAAVVAGGLIGGRAVDVMLNHAYFASDPVRVFCLWEGGMSLPGAVFGALLLVLIALRRSGHSRLLMADIVTPGAFLGLAIGGVGSLAVAGDFGRPADVAWAIRFPDVQGSLLPHPLIDVPLHPTQIYLSLVAFGIFLVTGLLLRWRRRRAGLVFCVGILLFAATRFYTDRFRADDVARGFLGSFSSPQLMYALLLALALFLLGLILLTRLGQPGKS